MTLSEDQFADTLYHGTRRRNVESIMRNGLRPAEGPLFPAKWYQLTTSREQAHRYAPSGDQAVVAVNIPKEEAADYLWPGAEHDVYGFDATAHGLKQTIPPKYLREAT